MLGFVRARTVTLVALVLLGIAPGGLAQGAATQTLGYDGYVSGVQAVRFDLGLQTNGTRLDMQARLRTVGLAALALRRDDRYQVEADYSSGQVRPASFQLTNTVRGEGIEITGGSVTETRQGQVIATRPVPEQAANSVDVLSAIADMLLQASQSGACEGSRIYYDGKELANITKSTIGVESVAQSRRQSLGGDTLLCRLTATSLTEREIGVSRIDLWSAPLVAGGLFVPIQMLWVIDGQEVRFHLSDVQ